jgi:hypothetical protein
MTYTMCSSVSVVSTLLQWYLQVFCMFQLLLGLSSLQVGVRLTNADRNSDASEGVCGTCNYDLRQSFRPWNNPTTHHHTVYYSACWYQIRETVCPTLQIKCNSNMNIVLLTSYVSSESLDCVFIFTYPSMSITPNMIIYRHHVNWPTYNTKTAQKRLLLQQIIPNTMQLEMPQKREIW